MTLFVVNGECVGFFAGSKQTQTCCLDFEFSVS